MNLNEILLLITLCWCSLLWLYIKYKTRKLPTFEQVLLYAGISLIITTVFTVLALFAHRIKKPGSQKTYEVIGFPITPLLYLAINAWILYYSFQKAFIESLIGCGIFLVGIILYFVMRNLERE